MNLVPATANSSCKSEITSSDCENICSLAETADLSSTISAFNVLAVDSSLALTASRSAVSSSISLVCLLDFALSNPNSSCKSEMASSHSEIICSCDEAAALRSSISLFMLLTVVSRSAFVASRSVASFSMSCVSSVDLVSARATASCSSEIASSRSETIFSFSETFTLVCSSSLVSSSFSSSNLEDSSWKSARRTIMLDSRFSIVVLASTKLDFTVSSSQARESRTEVSVVSSSCKLTVAELAASRSRVKSLVRSHRPSLSCSKVEAVAVTSSRHFSKSSMLHFRFRISSQAASFSIVKAVTFSSSSWVELLASVSEASR